MGFILRNNLNYDTQIGTLCASLHHRIFSIKNITKFTDFKTRLIFIKSLVIGKLIYCLPIYSQLTEGQISKLHKVIMTAARCSIGSYCFKKSKKYILDKCKMLAVKELIMCSMLLFVHKLITNKIPKEKIS